jgi:hypothetical protein
VATNLVINFNDRDLIKPGGNIHTAVTKHLLKKGKAVEMAAKRQVGVRTGALRASIHLRYGVDSGGQFVTVGSKLPYARSHHEGTRAHVIRPRKAQVLRFSNNGRVVYAHKVNHPGTKPNRYLTDNLRLIR